MQTVPDRTPAPTHEFLWFDLETTGLDPHKGLLLEFAAALCEDARGDDFAIVQQYSSAIHHKEAQIAAVKPDPVVLRMHAENRLWLDVAESTATLGEVDDFLTSLAASLTSRKNSIILAGTGVHFDLAWSRVHLPQFASYLSHRVFDLTTLRLLIATWGSGAQWPYTPAHRALDDVHASIAAARFARAELLGPSS